MKKKLDGLLGSASEDFARVAQELEARRLVMVKRQPGERLLATRDPPARIPHFRDIMALWKDGKRYEEMSRQ